MQHKCGAHDRGSGAGAIKYLIGLKDSKGRLRAGVEVLRGNPEQTAQLIDSLKTRNRYTSSVIAFHKDDAPTDAEIQAVVDDYERVTFAGLRKSQYTFCAVLHKEDDGCKHIHFIIPRVELESGRSLNVAPPGHEYYFAKWRNVWNHEKGWARPDDPTRARLVQPGKKAYRTTEEFKAGLTQATDQKVLITEYLTEQIEAGKVKTREDVLEVLSELGELNRVGKDYVSVRLSEDAKPIRLKGLLYGDNFSPDTIREVGAAQAARQPGRAEPDPAAAGSARVELEAAVRKRANYNVSYYSKPTRAAKHSAESQSEASQRLKAADFRLTQSDRFRAKYIEPTDKQTAVNDDVLAPNHDSSLLHSDDWISDAIRMANSEISARRDKTNSGSAAVQIKAAEHGILQRASRSEILQSQQIKNKPLIAFKNISLVEENHGLQQPSIGQFRAGTSDKYGAGIGSLPTLSGRNLVAVWPRAAMLLPTSTRSDLVERATDSTDQVRRADSSPGIDAAQDSGVANDTARDRITQIIEAAQRAARAASDTVSKCIAGASAAIQRATGTASTAIQRATATTGSSYRAAVETNRCVITACEHVDNNIGRIVAKMDDELERFKREISLSDYAISEFGYEKDVKKSSKNSIVLKAGGDEIIVTRGEDGHDIYFARGDEKDCGSIIDFVKHRVGDTNSKLVRVRQALRPWAPGAKKPTAKIPARAPDRPKVISKDLNQIVQQYAKLTAYTGKYLTGERRIKTEVIKAFKVMQDGRGNACFVHQDGNGVTGWETKNAGFTGFAAGGSRALYAAKPGQDPVKRIVVTEAAIDLMSYAQLKHKPGTLYVSTGGSQLSAQQQEQLKSVIERHAVPVVLAMDNDKAGHEMAEQVKALAPGVTTVRDLPQNKDWNEDLKSQEAQQRAQDAARERQAELARQRDAERGHGLGM